MFVHDSNPYHKKASLVPRVLTNNIFLLNTKGSREKISKDFPPPPSSLVAKFFFSEFIFSSFKISSFFLVATKKFKVKDRKGVLDRILQ